MTSVLVLGGVRSGKSRYAERLVAASTDVTYVAPGPVPDPALDPDWARRVADHRARRPAHWRTVETADVPAAILAAPGAVLVDCLGTWLTRLLDDAGGWTDAAAAEAAVARAIDALCAAVAASSQPVVLVSNEVGLGVVPEHRSGRLFRDHLGRLNAAVAGVCDVVQLVVAGRVLDLSDAPTVEEAPLPGEGASRPRPPAGPPERQPRRSSAR